MSEDQKPDTTEAVATALARKLPEFVSANVAGSAQLIARTAIAAHNEELKRLGYVTVKKPCEHTQIARGYGVDPYCIDCGTTVEVES